MENKDYTTSIVVDQSPSEVFAAINNVRGWWQGDIKGNTEKLGDEFTYEVPGIHFTKQKIVECIPDKKVVWLINESKIDFVKNKKEWLNTTITFEIAPVEDKTKLTFIHQGLVSSVECYDACSCAWEALVGRSLFSFITTGKGVNVF